MRLTPALLKRLVPSAAPARLKAICDTAPMVLPKYGITTPLRMTHFFAQLAHESGEFNIGRENINYRPANLAKIWDSGNWHGYFSSRSALMAMAGRGEELLNIVYGNRMGNGPPSSGDGYRYRGGGLAQITGKDGYAAMQKITGFPLVKYPEQVFDPDKMLEVAAAFWKWKNLQPLADRDDMIAIAMKWNGARKASSIIGLADRKAKLARARKIFTENLDTEPVRALIEPEPDDEPALVSGPDPEGAPPNVQPLDPSVRGDPVLFDVQTRLKARRYSPGFIDGQWGSGTSGALSGFMNDRGLRLHLPTSTAEFHEIADEVRAELLEAETEVQPDGSVGWYRPVSVARANADPKIVQELAPEVVPVKRNFLAGLWASIAAAVGSVWETISGYVSQAWDFFTDHQDVVDDHPGLMSTAWGYVTSVPPGVWWLMVAGGLAFITYNSWRAIKTSTLSVQNGERQ